LASWLSAATTMPHSEKKKRETSFIFFLLERSASRHLYVESVQVWGTPGIDDTVERVITRAARDAIRLRSDLTSTTEIDLTVYEVLEPLIPV
jgi:hypothetical protein